MPMAEALESLMAAPQTRGYARVLASGIGYLRRSERRQRRRLRLLRALVAREAPELLAEADRRWEFDQYGQAGRDVDGWLRSVTGEDMTTEERS